MIDLTFLRDLETLALTLNKESTSFGIGFLKVNLFVELSTLVFSYNSGPKVRITADSILETMMSTILSRDLPSRICIVPNIYLRKNGHVLTIPYLPLLEG